MNNVSEEMQQAVRNELKNREHVNWSATPIGFYSMFSATPAFLFSLPWIAFLLFIHQQLGEKNASIYVDIFVLPFYLIGIYLLLSPLIKWRKARNTLYIITNLRAFSLKLGRTVAVENFHPKNIGNFEKKIRSNGSGNLIFAREHYIDGDDDKRVADYGFFALPDVAEAERHLDKLLNASVIRPSRNAVGGSI